MGTPRAAPANVNRRRALRFAPWALLCAGVAWAAGPGGDRELADPTRPAQARDTVTAPGTGGPVLQSVLIAPGRRLAVIDGQTVSLGGRFGTATLVAVTETGVVLKEGKETRHLQLFPGVEKRAPVRSQGRKSKDQP
jgi:hypothetical protein